MKQSDSVLETAVVNNYQKSLCPFSWSLSNALLKVTDILLSHSLLTQHVGGATEGYNSVIISIAEGQNRRLPLITLDSSSLQNLSLTTSQGWQPPMWEKPFTNLNWSDQRILWLLSLREIMCKEFIFFFLNKQASIYVREEALLHGSHFIQLWKWQLKILTVMLVV